MSGSSPHGRGKPPRCRRLIRARRLIPARAGKTKPTPTVTRRCQAHPRTGGENVTDQRRVPRSFGSSPHGRGKPRRHDARSAPFGLIPARAGKTTRRRRRCRPGPAHPRTGGENRCRHVVMSCTAGSSPHGRGKRTTLNADRPHVGLIPARAGKTCCASRTSALSSGSSPHGRGKLPRRARHRRRYGLIPARAGKTTTIAIAR